MGRTRLGFEFLFGNFRTFHIVFRIRSNRFNLEKVAACFCGNHIGHNVGIAFLDVSYGVVLSGTGEECYKYFLFIHILALISLCIRCNLHGGKQHCELPRQSG